MKIDLIRSHSDWTRIDEHRSQAMSSCQSLGVSQTIQVVHA
jgi:hypothetical protein